jgi:hypothetical protein
VEDYTDGVTPAFHHPSRVEHDLTARNGVRQAAVPSMGAVAMAAISALNLLGDLDDLESQDPVTAFVIAELLHIAGEHHASISRLESGEVEIRFPTGEIFHLGKETITRVA